MEPQSNEHSPSPSGSDEMESDADSEHEDELENDKDSDVDDQNENIKEESDNSDDSDSDSDEDDDDNEAEEEEEEEEEEDEDCENVENTNENNSSKEDNFDTPKKSCSSNGSSESSSKSKQSKSRSHKPNDSDSEIYDLHNLPLEVITTVEPTTYSYPVLKNMSNGVLTQRNIFTEHERAVLKEIINKYRNIVDTRSRTREIYLEKQSVWQQIVEEYNSTENIMVRTEKELRKCWDNMKYRAKQAEKEMIKIEKSDGSFDGMDLHALTQQAFEDAVRFQQNGGGMTAKMGPQTEPQVKIERIDHDMDADNEYGDSNLDAPEGESYLSADEDREPALKRARQESPKLSSLLLAASRKNSSRNNRKKRDRNSNGHKISYNIPECTKVLHMKKKNHQTSLNSSGGVNSLANFPVSILPKGLAACLSITNIPNPVTVANHVANHVGSNYDYEHKDEALRSLTSPVHNSMKPMPSLKKMVPGKHQTNGNCKNLSSRSSKKSTSRLSKERENGNSSLNVNFGNDSGSLNSVQSMNNLLSTSGLANDNRCDSPEKLLSMKLTAQRLEFERQEHEMKMKLFEKELQSQTYQSQYWALRLKLLRSGRENNAFNLVGATNGDID